MNDINELLKLNLEIEGLLRILDSRDSDAAADRLGACFCEFSQKMNDFLLDMSATTDSNAPAALTPAPAPVADIAAAETPVEIETVEIEEPAPAEVEEERDEPAPALPEPAKPHAPATDHASLLKSFTLNDRFRFRRELFAGNDDDFNETLQLIADMDSYSEAEDYLLNDMMWNREDPAVVDFLEILANNMPR